LTRLKELGPKKIKPTLVGFSGKKSSESSSLQLVSMTAHIFLAEGSKWKKILSASIINTDSYWI